MQRGNQRLASFVLSAALVVPVGAMALSRQQDNRDQERHDQAGQQDRGEMRDQVREHRVYDPHYKQYHNWDSQEEAAYRQWLADRHHEYVDYEKLDARDQSDYWKWRHKEEKRDHHDEHQDQGQEQH